MPATYEPISTTTLGSAVNSVTLSSIPATYTDLVLVWKGSFSASGSGVGVRFNGDSGANYSENQLAAAGATAYQSQET